LRCARRAQNDYDRIHIVGITDVRVEATQTVNGAVVAKILKELRSHVVSTILRFSRRTRQASCVDVRSGSMPQYTLDAVLRCHP
jgi:hypothetical protein